MKIKILWKATGTWETYVLRMTDLGTPVLWSDGHTLSHYIDEYFHDELDGDTPPPEVLDIQICPE